MEFVPFTDKSDVIEYYTRPVMNHNKKYYVTGAIVHHGVLYITLLNDKEKETLKTAQECFNEFTFNNRPLGKAIDTKKHRTKYSNCVESVIKNLIRYADNYNYLIENKYVASSYRQLDFIKGVLETLSVMTGKETKMKYHGDNISLIVYNQEVIYEKDYF